MVNMETVNNMLKCPCCGAFITNSWAEKDALRKKLNRDYAKERRDISRQKKYGERKTKKACSSFDSKNSGCKKQEAKSIG